MFKALQKLTNPCRTLAKKKIVFFTGTGQRFRQRSNAGARRNPEEPATTTVVKPLPRRAHQRSF